MKGAPLLPIIRSNAALILHDMQNDFIKQSWSKVHRRYTHVVETEDS
jgi:nicotinamidase-related amidase